MVPVGTSLEPAVIEALDRAVAAGLAPNRSAIVAAAVERWLAEHSEDTIIESYDHRYSSPDLDHDALVARLASVSITACLAQTS